MTDYTKHPLYAVFPALCDEFDRSVEKHGPVKSHDLGTMIDACLQEADELVDAFMEGDNHGAHGAVTESLHLANTALKAHILARGEK